MTQEIYDGLLPNDFELIDNMVRDICYNNAERYFGFAGLSLSRRFESPRNRRSGTRKRKFLNKEGIRKQHKHFYN